VLLSHGPLRRRLWKSHRGFQASHVILACLLAALVAVHVVVTARYVGGIGRRALYIAATIGALALLLRARRPPQSARQAPSHPILVFGRHSALVVSAVAICAAALTALLPASVDASLREPPFRPPQLCRRNGRIPVCRVPPQPADGFARWSRGAVSRILSRLPSASERLARGTRAPTRTRLGLPRLPSGARRPRGGAHGSGPRDPLAAASDSVPAAFRVRRCRARASRTECGSREPSWSY
jgi:hypothetical protein